MQVHVVKQTKFLLTKLTAVRVQRKPHENYPLYGNHNRDSETFQMIIMNGHIWDVNFGQLRPKDDKLGPQSIETHHLKGLFLSFQIIIKTLYIELQPPPHL